MFDKQSKCYCENGIMIDTEYISPETCARKKWDQRIPFLLSHKWQSVNAREILICLFASFAEYQHLYFICSLFVCPMVSSWNTFL